MNTLKLEGQTTDKVAKGIRDERLESSSGSLSKLNGIARVQEAMWERFEDGLGFKVRDSRNTSAGPR